MVTDLPNGPNVIASVQTCIAVGAAVVGVSLFNTQNTLEFLES